MNSNESNVELLGDLVEACMDQDDLRDCLIRKSREAPGCKPRVYLVTDPDCGACQSSEERLAAYIDRGDIEILPSAAPLAQKLLADIGLQTVPALILADCEGSALAELEI